MDPNRPASSPLPTAVRWAQAVLETRLAPGDVVVDATAGNGHDTLFLARKVLPGGRLYAFDVQADAITQTRERLVQAGAGLAGVTLIHGGHETLSAALPPEHQGRLRACMFNLGYLPGGDKSRITRESTTLSALEQAAAQLEEDGVMTVVVYPGHEGGREEAGAVEQWMRLLSPSLWETQKMGFLNFRPGTPCCMVARRRTAKAP